MATRAAIFAALVLAVLAASSAPARAGAAVPKAHSSTAGGYYPIDSAWPWTTALVDPSIPGDDFSRNFCTAVLIAPQRVLTAAHCVVGPDRVTPRSNDQFQALVGRRDLRNTAQGVRRNVTGIAVHPKVYLPTAAGPHQYHAFYDLAVLFLDRPVNIPPAPIGLPTDGDFGEGLATAMGWGHVNYDHAHPQRTPYLKAADFALYNDDQCSYYFDDATTQHHYPAIHLCVGDAPGGYLDCITHGDSGAPLMVLEGGQWKLIGITSFYPHGDYACNGAGPPFGFAWVAGPTLRSWPLTVANPGDSGVGGGGALDLSMSRREVRGYIRAMIHENTNGKIRRLRARCHRLSYRSTRCRLRWRIKRRVYSGKARFWHYAQNGEPYWTYSFKGKRRRIGHSRYKRLRW